MEPALHFLQTWTSIHTQAPLCPFLPHCSKSNWPPAPSSSKPDTQINQHVWRKCLFTRPSCWASVKIFITLSLAVGRNSISYPVWSPGTPTPMPTTRKSEWQCSLTKWLDTGLRTGLREDYKNVGRSGPRFPRTGENKVPNVNVRFMQLAGVYFCSTTSPSAVPITWKWEMWVHSS